MTNPWHLLIVASPAAFTAARGSALNTAGSNPAPQMIESDRGETAQVRITRALSAGPDDITKAARVVDTDANGKSVVLREGMNGFTCTPAPPLLPNFRKSRCLQSVERVLRKSPMGDRS